MDFDYILSQEESKVIEYKKEWYWHDKSNSDEKNKGLDELYKDFSALFNTEIGSQKKKYLIIGFDEKKGTYHNYDSCSGIDGVCNEIQELKNSETIKEYLLKKFNKKFSKHPNDVHNLPELENFIEVDTCVRGENRILIISISDAPYLIYLNSPLSVGKYPEHSILHRVESNTGPSVSTMSHDQVQLIVTKLDHNDLRKYLKKETSIEKIINAYKSESYPKASVEVSGIKQELTKKFKFELYTIRYKKLVHSILFLPKSANQQGTINYLLENNAFNGATEVTVLMENYNDNQPKRIPLLFKEYFDFSNVPVLPLQQFIRDDVYGELLNADIFYNGKNTLVNFITPYSSEDETVDGLLESWYFSTSIPILVMKGPGGIGKTTVVRHFLGSKNLNGIKKLFISSHEIANELNRSEYKIETLFDFYKIMFDKDELSNKIDKEIFEIAIDSGDVLIVIDGLDEIIAKNGNKFNVPDFIESISNNYCNNIAKAKIIITCRDYFWDRFNNINETIISLKAFTEDMAKEFFKKSFPNPTQSKIEKAMNLTRSFIDSECYIPYILDMVREIFLEKIDKNESIDGNHTINSKVLCKDINIDRIIGKSCDREILKLENISIDEQIKFFKELAVKFNGSISGCHVDSVLKACNFKYSSSIIEKFKGHPLILANQDQINFRYDFFNDYFRVLAIVEFLNDNNDFSTITDVIYDLMKNIIKYKNDATKDILKRLIFIAENDEVKVKENIILKLIDFNEHKETQRVSNFSTREFNSIIFTLLLSLPLCNNEEARTELMCDIYEKNNVISNLSIIDINSNGGSKLTFNFTGKKIINSYFSGYRDFTKCKFDSNTYFLECSFKTQNYTDLSNISFEEYNFSDTCELGELGNIIKQINKITVNKENSLKVEVLSFIKLFWKYGEFKPVKKELVTKNFQKNTKLIERLLKLNVIKLTKITTSEKRKDDFFIIHPEYQNLRKIMEENNTCFEFEKIIKFLNKE